MSRIFLTGAAVAAFGLLSRCALLQSKKTSRNVATPFPYIFRSYTWGQGEEGGEIKRRKCVWVWVDRQGGRGETGGDVGVY